MVLCSQHWEPFLDLRIKEGIFYNKIGNIWQIQKPELMHND